MLDRLESLSLESGAVVVAIASGLFATVLAQVRFPGLRWTLALGTPLVISYSLYWSPVWLGASSVEYPTWAPLFIAPWYLAGVIVSTFVVYTMSRRITHGAQDG